MRNEPRALFAILLIASSVLAAEVPATVQGPAADVYAAPRFDAAKLARMLPYK